MLLWVHILVRWFMVLSPWRGKRSPWFTLLWRSLSLLGAILLLAACGSKPTTPSGTTQSPSPTPFPTLVPNAPSQFHPGSGAALALTTCSLVSAPGGCYSPEQIQTFYDLNSLYAKGYEGQGITIVIIDAFGSPTIKSDLHTFDQTFGLPDPPKFDILSPLGQKPFNSNNTDMVGWAGETTLDVEWAHAIAPKANIVLLTSPETETEGVQGFPQFEQLSIYALDHKLGQVFSMSFGASEPTLVGDACKEGLGTGESLRDDYDKKVFERAQQEHITLLASSGDDGSTNVDCKQKPYNFQNVGWPASDPLVTAVGGTKLSLKDGAGHYGSEKIWDELGGAGGGGISQFYAEPDWQKQLPDQSLLKGKRGIPDVAWGAAVNIPYYHSYGGDIPGWTAIGGTSASAPQWAGLIALADQMAGKPLGFLNPALYKLAGKGFHDVTKGNNGLDGVAGFQAGTGYDLASGWGTPDGAVLLPLLITTVETSS